MSFVRSQHYESASESTNANRVGGISRPFCTSSPRSTRNPRNSSAYSFKPCQYKLSHELTYTLALGTPTANLLTDSLTASLRMSQADMYSLGATMLELAIGSTLPMDGSLCQALRQDKAPLPKRLNANSQLVKYIKVTVASLTPLPSPWSHSHGIISPKQNSSLLSLSVHADSVTACRQRGLKCVSARDAARHFCLRPPARGQRLRQYAEARRRGGRASGASCCSPARCRGAPNKQEPRVDGGEIIYT